MTLGKVLGAFVGLAILGAGYVAYSLSTPVKTVRFSNGTAGAFAIGETKETILSRLPDETFSPRPKPKECPKNWIEVSNMSATEKACLLSTDTWMEGNSSTRGACPENTDVNTELRFTNGKLSEVVTECWRSK
jgi:hypothetical protein